MVMQLIEKNFITRFGVPTSLFYISTYLSSLKLYEFYFGKGIVWKHSSNYYAEDNGLVKSISNNLIFIIKRKMGTQQHN